MNGREDTMPASVTIELHPSLFGEGRRLVAESGKLRAAAFRYATGVAALVVENGVGTAALLPFQGQQIWDAHFLGRRLTMHSMFEEPRPTRDYLATYGAFFIHCGGTAMGNPGPTDTHPLHGELPNMPYDTAQLTFGEDGDGAYMELTGMAHDALAFHHSFVARPRIRLREGAAHFEVSMEVENRSGRPMPFLYLGHINFRPVDGGVLVDAVSDGRTGIAVRQPDLPADEDDAVRAYHRAVADDPASHRILVPGVPVQPELVLTMMPATGADGWTHALQRHPSGTADFVSHRPVELPYAVRWLTRGPDQDALGLVLPATAPPDGFAAAKANRQLVWIAPYGTWRAEMHFGALEVAAARSLRDIITSIRDRWTGAKTQ